MRQGMGGIRMVQTALGPRRGPAVAVVWRLCRSEEPMWTTRPGWVAPLAFRSVLWVVVVVHFEGGLQAVLGVRWGLGWLVQWYRSWKGCRGWILDRCGPGCLGCIGGPGRQGKVAVALGLPQRRSKMERAVPTAASAVPTAKAGLCGGGRVWRRRGRLGVQGRCSEGRVGCW